MMYLLYCSNEASNDSIIANYCPSFAGNYRNSNQQVKYVLVVMCKTQI